MYDLLFLGNAYIGENKCGTVMVKLVFLINGYSCNIKMWLNISKLTECNNGWIFDIKVNIKSINVLICQRQKPRSVVSLYLVKVYSGISGMKK